MIIDMRLRPPSLFTKGTPPDLFVAAPPTGPTSASPRSVESCVREMEDAGVVGVIMGRQAGGSWGKIRNDDIAHTCKAYPGRFLAFAGVDISNPDPSAALAEVERCVKQLRFSGVNIEPGISARPQYADDPSLFPIYARCHELDTPVSISLSVFIAPDIDYVNPVAVQRVAKAFPQLKIIVSHACWPWVHQAIGVADLCPNVYLSPDFYITSRKPGYMDYVQAENTSLKGRVLFGTASPFSPPLKEQVAMWRQLPFQSIVDVLGGSAARILKVNKT